MYATCSENKYYEHVELLKRVAAKSPVLQKHAACVLKRGRVIAVGLNKYFRIKLNEKSYDICVHAEMDALACLDASEIKGCDILVIRLGKNNTIGLSRPCNACIDKMQQKRLKKAYYTLPTGNVGYEYVDVMPKLHNSASSKIREKLLPTA
jgi:deoxycytidylate deaminase